MTNMLTLPRHYRSWCKQMGKTSHAGGFLADTGKLQARLPAERKRNDRTLCAQELLVRKPSIVARKQTKERQQC